MLIPNTLPDAGLPLDTGDATAFGTDAAQAAAALFALTHAHGDTHARGDAATPLTALPALAVGLGLHSLHVKDEGGRHGLGSFKALGGAHAVIRLVLAEAARRLGRPVAAGDLGTVAVRAIAGTMTVSCATDGNHGRSVAAGARLVGARSVVFLHRGVSEVRAAAIREQGARIVVVDGDYDDSLAQAGHVAAAEGWINVSDMALPGDEQIPTLVMQGYTVMAAEILRQMPQPPSHLFIQAGVGGVAGALAAHMTAVLGDSRPQVVVVEPDRAPCLFDSARAGHRLRLDRHRPTVMAMLECREPSVVAWRILARLAAGFMTVADDEAMAAVDRLARPLGRDPAILAGESGAAGLAGLLQAVSDPASRAALALDDRARVLVIATEGANDPQNRHRLAVTAAPP